MTDVALVCFATETGEFALPVGMVRGVRAANALHALPDARPDVAGLLHVDGRPIPVVSLLGAKGDHVLVVRPSASEGPRREFGLLALQVHGVIRVDQAAVSGPPEGQRHGLCAGVVVQDRGLVLIVDPAALARVLAQGDDAERMASSPGPPSLER